MDPFGLIGNLALLAVAAWAAGLLLINLSRAPFALPPNNLQALARRGGKGGRPLCVCAGDSITQGMVSASYVDALAARLPGIEFANAGLNNELAWNLFRRADEILRAEPDFIAVLIGTNDLIATLGRPRALRYLAEQGLPRLPSAAFYESCLRALLVRLRAGTSRPILVMSPPPIGEDPASAIWARSIEYAEMSRRAAADEGADYVDLNAAMRGAILRARAAGGLRAMPPLRGIAAAERAATWKRLVLGRDYDAIAAARGFTHVTDFVHLSGRGAAVVADALGDWLRERS